MKRRRLPSLSALRAFEAAARHESAKQAALVMEIRGFGPVKEANERKAAKRREELLAAFRDGGSGLARAAE